VAAAFALPSLEESDHWKIPGNWNLIRPAFTRDLTRYAAPSDEDGFAVFDAATRQVLQTVPPAGKPGEAPGIFAFDRSGTRVAASSVDMSAGRSVTEVHELSDESPRLLGRFENSGVTGAVPVLFADGRIIVQGDDGLRIGRDEGDLVALALPVEKGRVIGMSLALSPDETRLAAALEDPPGLVVWALDHPTPRRVWQIEREAVPQCLTWSGDDEKLAFADRGTAPVSLVVAGAGDGNIHATLPGHGKPVATLAFHPDGDSIASVGFDQWVVWQAIEAGGFRVRIPGNPGPLGFSDDGTRLAYSPARGSLGLAAAAPPHGWRRWPGSGGLGTVTCSEASPDGRRLAVATLDGLALWDAEHGRRLDFHPWQTAAVRWPWFRIAPAGDFLVCSDSDVPMTRWPITGTGFGTVESVVAPRSGTYIMHDFSRTGNDWLVSADRVQREISATTNFYIWPEGDPSRERLLAPAARANGLTLIPPGSRFALASHSHLADARLWDGATAREIRALGHPEPVLLAVSPDGTRACTIGAAEGRLWNTGGWSLIASWSQQGRGRSAPFFCPDSRYFATTTAAGHVTIRHAADGATYLELTPPRDLAAPEVRWLGRDRLLLVSSLDGFHEWNLAVLKAAATREGAPW
jgi:WD40 repeat protein